MSPKFDWRKWVRVYVLAIPFVIVVSLLVFYVFIPNSTGFEAARSAVMRLPDVQAEVGRVRKVDVLPFRPYRIRFAGSTRIETLPLEVTGDSGKLKMLIRMIRTEDRWRVEYWETIW
jgi:hypothetical protein